MQKVAALFIEKKKIGLWSDISCFSFEEKKIMTTGDGGMICLNDKKLYEKIKSLSFHGWDSDPWSRHKKSFGKKINLLIIGRMKLKILATNII